MKNIVVIGGGTGIFTVLSGLKKYPVNLSAIISMADDGGSTKILREEFGVLPPGSIRPALVALSDSSESLANLFNYRFSQGNLKNHNFGNLLITALSQMYGDFEKAIAEAGKLLNIKGKVIPSTLDSARLFAQLENGKIIKGETNIDIPKHNSKLKIENVFLKPKCKINKQASQTITKANLIIIGPGDLYTSIIPNLLVKQIPQAIQKSRAKKIYICNLMTKLGETNNFSGKDFVETIEKYLGKNVLNYVIFNNKKPSKARVIKYEKEKAGFVEYNKKDFENKNFQTIEANFLRNRGFIRHCPEKLAKTIMKILFDES
ncbi:hypothetical protein AMJ49_03845 [Parcubacteria bacterium DG_74_2]|nr:MAG: hypothetical protein AMJ49_03845 [Parcubacteria bacterium DG_74_2]